MSRDAQTIEPKRRRRLKAWHILLIGLGLLILLFGVWRIGVAWRLNSEIEAIRAAGYPMSLEELDQWDGNPPLKAKEGADLYRKAFEKIVQKSTKRVPIVTKGFVWPKARHTHPPMREKILTETRQYLEANAEALELLHEAGEYDRTRFRQTIPHNPMKLHGRGALFSITALSSCRMAGHLLTLEAMVNIERRRAEPMIEAVADAWGLADALQREPFSAEHMVAWSIREQVLRRIVKRALNRMTLKPGELRALAAAMPAPNDTENVWRRTVGEWASTAEMMTATPPERMDQVYAGTLGESKYLGWLNRFYVASGLSHLDRLLYVSAHRRALELADEPMPKRLRGLKRLKQRIDGASPLWTQWFSDWANVLCQTAPISARVAARIRTAHTAIAVERYRLAEGELPEELADVVPHFLMAVPTDPFTGDPLGYRKLEEGFTVYSVGDDLTDNGGARTTSKGKSYGPGTDLPFTLKR